MESIQFTKSHIALLFVEQINYYRKHTLKEDRARFTKNIHKNKIIHYSKTTVLAISYPESSCFLVSRWASGETLENSKNLNFLIGCPVTVCIVLPQKSCINKILVPQSLSWQPTAGQRARGLWVRDCSIGG